MRIKIEFQGPGFVAVPNHVATMIGGRLSPDALAVLVRLALLPVGSTWNVATLRKMVSMGDFRWRQVAECLRDLGALHDERVTGEDGRHRGSVLSVRWPDAPVGARKAGAVKRRTVGKPGRGKPTQYDVGKPGRGKPTSRCAEVIEIEGEKPRETAQSAVSPKTKTGEAAAPQGVAAASPAPEPANEVQRVGRSDEEKARAQAMADEAVRALLCKVAAEPSALRLRRGGVEDAERGES